MRIEKILIVLTLVLVSCAPVNTPIPTEMAVEQAATVTIHHPTATATLLPKTVTPTKIPYPTYEFFPSPDGKRILRGEESPDPNRLEIIKDGKVEWSISYNRSRPNLFNQTYRPYFWSNDGRYLYLTVWRSMGGGFGVFYTGSGLSRFDVLTGDMTTIIAEDGMFAFEVSPDESQIVYVNENENPVVLKSYHLDTHSEQVLLILDKQYEQAGSIGWSPKMDKLIFMTMMEVKNEQIPDYSFGIFLLDLGNKKMSPIAENLSQWLTFNSWDEKSQVLYNDWEDTIWQLDLKSKVLLPKGTATPWP